MPISYTVDASRRLVLEVWSGEVDAQEIARYWRELVSDPGALACRRTLCDIREMEPRFTGPEFASLVRSILIPVLAEGGWTSAIVVREPVQYGVARQYEVFAESFSADAIFHDLQSALAWLEAR